MKKILFSFLVGALAGAFGFWYLDRGRKKDDLPTAIREELARPVEAVREKAKKAGDAIADTASDTWITTEIKGKLLAQTDLSGFSINVATTDGVVTLSGKVSTQAQIDKAVQTALDTRGVRRVYHTIQLGPSVK